MAAAAILRYDAPAFHMITMAMLCVRNMSVDLICANYTHSIKGITFHILRINAGFGLMSNLSLS